MSSTTALVLPGTTFARINWGRPVVDCPRCTSAKTLPAGTAAFDCDDCGAGADIVWPVNFADVVTVLALRPDPKTRNWEVGETVLDLVQQNLEHGILPPLGELEAHRGPLLLILDDRIVAGHPALGGN